MFRIAPTTVLLINIAAVTCAGTPSRRDVAKQVRWVPDTDLLSEILERVEWRMSVDQFKTAFEGLEFTEQQWRLNRGSFRKNIDVPYPNTEVVFEFSGVVDTDIEEIAPVSSVLIGFTIKHPIKSHPVSYNVRPPKSPHYIFIKELHDRYLKSLEGEKYDRKTYNVREYVAGEEYRCKFGHIAFTYWTNIGTQGVVGKAPPELVADDLAHERKAALHKTRNWPIEICGND